jgi:hypothetical protein
MASQKGSAFSYLRRHEVLRSDIPFRKNGRLLLGLLNFLPLIIIPSIIIPLIIIPLIVILLIRTG